MSDYAGTAEFSPCRRYRYMLSRFWVPAPKDSEIATFIGLNPSTADENADDPTIRRCVSYAKAWGYKGLVMTNLFAFRSTDPVMMWKERDPVGPENNWWIQRMADRSGVTVAAWGAFQKAVERAGYVKALVGRLHVLKLTKDGRPAHPLYLPGDLKPTPWWPTQEAS